MKAILTSSLGGSKKVNGVRIPDVLIEKNGLVENLKQIWTQNAKVLIICADPYDYEKNDSICICLKESFPMSGLSISNIEICDNRNSNRIDSLENVDVIVLTGGHIPTQNKFMKRLDLKNRLLAYNGIVIAWSAGSMNCANKVYAAPELDGEGSDPLFERWISGLDITEINIFPHYQSIKEKYLDGLHIIEDIIFPDSIGHEIIALNDGSYIMIADGHQTLYGEAYMIKDGRQRQICKDGEAFIL